MPKSHSAALPITYLVLRVLIVLNLLSGLAILALLVSTIVAEDWTLTALGIAPDSYIRPIMTGLRVVAALGVVAIPLNHLVLLRLKAIVETVWDGDPFVAANAVRLQAIAWTLLILQLISIVVGFIGKAISTPANPIHLDAGFSPSGWLAVLLTFVLARIFVYGTWMRDDIVAIPLNHLVLLRLKAIVETVWDGDPFVAANAVRLQAIAWTLLILQLISIVIGFIGKTISTPANPIHLDAGFSPSGWLAVLLTSVLARIFVYGTWMRDDIVGTV